MPVGRSIAIEIVIPTLKIHDRKCLFSFRVIVLWVYGSPTTDRVMNTQKLGALTVCGVTPITQSCD